MKNSIDYSFTHTNIKELSILIMLTLTIEALFYFSTISSNLVSYVGVIVIAIVSIILSVKLNTFLFFLLLANQRLLVIPISNISLINIVILVILAKALINNRFVVKRKLIIIMMIFSIYASIAAYLNNDFLEIIIAVKVILLFMMLMNLDSFFKDNRELYIKSALCFAIGCIIMGLLGIVFDSSISVGTKYRFSGSDYNNPNDYAMMITFAMSNLVLLLDVYKRKKVIIIMICVLTFFGLLTQSRTFIFGIVLVVTFCGLFNKKNIKKIKFNPKLIFTFIIIAAFMLSLDKFRVAVEASLDRVINAKNSDISGSRFQIWNSYYWAFKENPNYFIWGAGHQSSHLKLGVGQVAHNFIIELIATWGIIGSNITLLLFVYVLRVKSKIDHKLKTSNSAFGYLPLIVLLILSLTRHSPLNVAFISQFFISIYFIKFYKTRERIR